LVVTSIAAGLIVGGVLFFILAGGSPPPQSPQANAKSIEKSSARVVTSTSAAPMVETKTPAADTHESDATPIKQVDREELAIKAFDAMQKECNSLPANDKDGRIARAKSYLNDYGDTIASARARVMIRQLTEPPRAAAHTSDAAPPVQPAAAPTNTDGTVLFEENFDGPTCSGLAFGELSDGPAGSHGKVGKGRRGDGYTKVTIADWAVAGNRKVVYTVSERTHFRFRYYNVNCRDVQFLVIVNDKVYSHKLESDPKNAWRNADIEIKELLSDDTKTPLALGSAVGCSQLDGGSGLGSPKELYMDDFIVIDVKP
jgi:hypothetical protein